MNLYVMLCSAFVVKTMSTKVEGMNNVGIVMKEKKTHSHNNGRHTIAISKLKCSQHAATVK